MLNKYLFEKLNNGEFVKVKVKSGTLGCSDVQDLCNKNGYVVVYKKNDCYCIDDETTDENVLCVDDFNYIDMIVEKCLDVDILKKYILNTFPLSKYGLEESDLTNENLGYILSEMCYRDDNLWSLVSIGLNHIYSNKSSNEYKIDFNDLSEEEIEQCVESWYSIREAEENRCRNEVNKYYPDPMPTPIEVREILTCCRFYKNKETGYICVDV